MLAIENQESVKISVLLHETYGTLQSLESIDTIKSLCIASLLNTSDSMLIVYQLLDGMPR